MKNSEMRLGPQPSLGRPRKPLSSSRSALLGVLRAQIEPTTLAALVNLSGLHPNTVREHLTALVNQGLAQREPRQTTGRGRPAWLYQATGPDAAASPEYAGLAVALASAIHHSTDDPWERAVTAGEEWGHQLAVDRGAVPSTASTARRGVRLLLDEMGFDPVSDDDQTLRLTRCPLLEAAHRYTEAVCGVHLGLARGALKEHGVDPAGTRLVPFAEPGACVLRLEAGEPAPT